MAPSRNPVTFLSLPVEIRLSIYQYAIPHRTLQVGFDFPFPYLPDIKLADPSSEFPDLKLADLRVSFKKTHLYHGAPVITTPIPTIFHLCQESRRLALAEYIPFSYSYLHPANDILYISKEASVYMYFSELAFPFDILADIYPLAAVERLMVEFVWENLDHIRFITNNLCHLIRRFGLPKEIIFVTHQSTIDLDGPTRHFHGYEGLEMVATPQPGWRKWSEALMRKRLADRCGKSEWVENWDVVKLTAMDIKHEGVVSSPFTRLDENEAMRVLKNAYALLERWHKDQPEASKSNVMPAGEWNGRKNVERLFKLRGVRCPWTA